jgi:23S rRNA pseudouridine1911/1915/1917 synthase
MVAAALPDYAIRAAIAAEDVPLDVLYEDDHLIAINKPSGVVVHPTYKHAQGTIINALLWQARNWPDGRRPSLVGRLDKLTSGIVLVAKTASSHAALQRRMASQTTAKDYLAVVYGRVNAASGEIDLRLARDPRDQRRVVASKTNGAPSLTCFERLGRVDALDVGLSLLRCRLGTGRTHQIRVHLAARGWPVVGDPTYGEPHWSRIADPILAEVLRSFERQALHAWRLAFTHPLTGECLQLEAPIPGDFRALLTAVGLHHFVNRAPSMSTSTIGAIPVAFSGPSMLARSPTMTIDRCSRSMYCLATRSTSSLLTAAILFPYCW